MSVTVDRPARLHEVLADADGDIAEALLWPVLAALGCGQADPKVRHCAATFAQLTADVLALEAADEDDPALWRSAVFSLAAACQEATDLLAAVQQDAAREPLAAVLRQMLGVTEMVADWLEGPRRSSSRAPSDQPPDQPPAREPATAHRRRPWFGREVEGEQLWSGETTS